MIQDNIEEGGVRGGKKKCISKENTNVGLI